MDDITNMVKKKTMRATGLLDISVRNPHTYDKFTSFEVAIQTRNPAFSSSCSRTRRHYTEFCWLRKRLKNHHPLKTPPKLPSKKNNLERSDPQFLVQRMKELEDWLYDIVDTTLYLSDTSVHLFLQTQLSCDQIDQYLSGKLSESEKEKAERQCNVESDGKSLPEEEEDGENISASMTDVVQTHVVHEPVHIRSTVSSHDSAEEPDHIRIHTSSSHRGDSGLAISSESDCDSSYESNSTSLQGSYESYQRSFPALTLVQDEAGNQDRNEQTTSPFKNDSGAGPSGHMTSHSDHMMNHSAQTSLLCEGGIVYTKQVDFLPVIDSETQTPRASVDSTQTQDASCEISKLDSGAQKAKGDKSDKTEMVAEYLSQLSVETGYSINADFEK